MNVRAREHCDRHEHERCGGGTCEVRSEAVRVHRVGEHEQHLRDESTANPEQRNVRDATERLATLGRDPHALLERPVAELRGHDEPGGEDGRRPVELRVVDAELRRVERSEQRERHRDERRPAEYQRREEREEGRDREPRAGDPDVLAPARERERGERDRARQGTGAGR